MTLCARALSRRAALPEIPMEVLSWNEGGPALVLGHGHLQ